MTEMVVKKANVLGEDGSKFILEYYLAENTEGDKSTYGVEIVKRGPGENTVTRSTVAGLVFNKYHLLEIIKKLADGDVTPMCLQEMLEDVLEESKYELMVETV